MGNIKLFVCCHRPFEMPEHSLLTPIQVGAALSDSRFEGFLYDDSGDNISAKNPNYCELTAQYWAWKNLDADYYGLFHYRRFLYPDEREKRPYRIEGKPTQKILDTLGYAKFAEQIEQYDIILPKAEEMHVSVREHYQTAPYHHKKDLELAEEIIREKFPEYIPAMEQYLSGTAHYFGNIQIMKRQEFFRYCTWLFSILEEFDCRADTSQYSAQEKRVDGYLAERLLGVYYTQIKRKGELKTLELPRVCFILDAGERARKRIMMGLLPPGSRLRAWIKAMVRGVR